MGAAPEDFRRALATLHEALAAYRRATMWLRVTALVLAANGLLMLVQILRVCL